jgi:hypothetical protein
MKLNFKSDLLSIICGTIAGTIVSTSIYCFFFPAYSWIKVGIVSFFINLSNCILLLVLFKKMKS